MLFYPQGVKIINPLLLGVYEFMIFTIFEKNFNLSEKFSSSNRPHRDLCKGYLNLKNHRLNVFLSAKCKNHKSLGSQNHLWHDEPSKAIFMQEVFVGLLLI